MGQRSPPTVESKTMRETEDQDVLPIGRRTFLQATGIGALAMGFAGCTGNESGSGNQEGEVGSNNSGDTGESSTNSDSESVTDTSQSRDGSDESEGDDITRSESTSASNGDSNTETESGSGSDDTGRTTSDTNRGTAQQFVQEESGSVESNTVDELEIVAWKSSVSDGEFSVQVAVKNTGDQQANAEGYTFDVVPYDEDGAEIDTQGSATDLTGKTEMGPSGIGSVRVIPSMENPETVASYKIKLHCDGPYAEGVYCSN